MHTEQEIRDARNAVWNEWHQLDGHYWITVWTSKTFIHYPWQPYVEEDYVNPDEDKKEEELIPTKVPHLRVVKGGKDGGGDTPSDNWLLDMERGDMFFACDKNTTLPFAEEYMVIDKSASTVYLQFDDHRGQGRVRVVAELFVKHKVFLERIERVVPFEDDSR
jgi:hypothetical protein